MSEVADNGIKDGKELKLQISSVSIHEYRRGIPIPNNDFSILAKTLEIYARGVGRVSDVTRNDFVKTSYVSFPVAMISLERDRKAGIPLINPKGKVAYSSDPFINNIVKDAHDAYEERNKRRGYGYSKSFDYDGEGRFHKTTVKVDFDDENGSLILSMHAAYVGDEVEKELADYLNVERAVTSKCLEVQLPDFPDQDLTVPLERRHKFILNCDPLSDIVNSVMDKFVDPNIKFTPSEIAKSLMKANEYREDKGEFSVSLGDGLCLKLSISGGYRFVMPEGMSGLKNLIDSRKLEGNTIVLPFPTALRVNEPLLNYETPRKQIKNYTISITIQREAGNEYSRLPFHTQKHLEKAGAVLDYVKGLMEASIV